MPTQAVISRPTQHVLLVEDDAPIRGMLADVLQDAGFSVVQASDGLEAVRNLREERPDLIVLDLMLPRMSGWQFLEESRPDLERANIPVVVLSAIHGQGDYPSTLGVAAWLTKPVDIDRFLGAVQTLADPAPPNGTKPRSARPARVLVIEDEDSIRDLVIGFLNDAGYQTDSAGSIPEALTRVAAQRPSLIVLDLMLPGHSGWAFLRDRDADPMLASIPVVVTSAAPVDRLLESKQLGAEAFLRKPFDFDALGAVVRSFVG
jgi:DNA-binding response OmpR family regulator